eukprot:jgi/Chlat1/7675/Chrsp64S07135
MTNANAGAVLARRTSFWRSQKPAIGETVEEEEDQGEGKEGDEADGLQQQQQQQQQEQGDHHHPTGGTSELVASALAALDDERRRETEPGGDRRVSTSDSITDFNASIGPNSRNSTVRFRRFNRSATMIPSSSSSSPSPLPSRPPSSLSRTLPSSDTNSTNPKPVLARTVSSALSRPGTPLGGQWEQGRDGAVESWPGNGKPEFLTRLETFVGRELEARG